MSDIRDELWKLCQDERLEEALSVVETLDEEVVVSRDTIYRLLQLCIKTKDLTSARRVHMLMVKSGLDSSSFLGDHLIRLFALCGSLLDASQVFCKIPSASTYTWNAIIQAHVRFGEGGRAVELYQQMQQGSVRFDKCTFLCVLKACTSTEDLGQGRLIHQQIISTELESDVLVASALVDMYAKSGCLQEAFNVFNNLSDRDVVCWGAMIGGYAQHGYGIAAFELFEKMQNQSMKPNKVIYLCILKACCIIRSISQ